MRTVHQISVVIVVGSATLCWHAHAVDAASLRAKLNRYYEQQGVELGMEQRRFIQRQGPLDGQRRQRLRQKLNTETVEQRRLQRRQTRQIEPWRRSFSAPGLQAPSRGRPRADSSTLQRFQRQQRQLRFQLRTQRQRLR